MTKKQLDNVYGNTILYGLTWATTAPLQRAQNAAAWIVLGPRQASI